MLDQSPVVDVLRDGYGIRHVRTVSEHHGSQSKIWKLRVNDHCLGLRRTRPLGDGRLWSYCRLARLLRDNGILLTCPIETVDGELFFRHAGDSYVLYDWIEGVIARERELAVEDAWFLGGLLARIHQVLAGFDEQLPLPKREYASNASALNDIKRLITVVHSKAEISEYDQTAYDDLKYKYAVLESKGERQDPLALLYEERQLVHGDFTSGNILFTSDGRLAGLIDLDTFHYAPRIYDIVKACRFTFKAKSDCCIRFLSGYHRVNPLNSKEIGAFHPLAMDYVIKNIWDTRNISCMATCTQPSMFRVQCYELLVRDEI